MIAGTKRMGSKVTFMVTLLWVRFVQVTFYFTHLSSGGAVIGRVSGIPELHVSLFISFRLKHIEERLQILISKTPEFK